MPPARAGRLLRGCTGLRRRGRSGVVRSLRSRSDLAQTGSAAGGYGAVPGSCRGAHAEAPGVAVRPPGVAACESIFERRLTTAARTLRRRRQMGAAGRKAGVLRSATSAPPPPPRLPRRLRGMSLATTRVVTQHPASTPMRDTRVSAPVSGASAPSVVHPGAGLRLRLWLGSLLGGVAGGSAVVGLFAWLCLPIRFSTHARSASGRGAPRSCASRSRWAARSGSTMASPRTCAA